MTLRQICNVAYVAQVEHMDEKEFAQFERELVADPTVRVSRGTGDLMKVMAGFTKGR